MKKSLKLFFLAASVTTMGVAASAPILASCSNSNGTKIYFDANNQQLTVNNSKLVFNDANDNLFNAYKTLISTDEQSISKVATYKSNLEKLCTDYLSSLNLTNTTMTFDFDNIQIDGWSFIIPTTITSTSSREDNPVLLCKNTKVSFAKKDVDTFLTNNTLTVKASEAFPGSSLSNIETQLKDIIDLKPTDAKYEEFFSRISKWASGSIIFKANNFDKPTYEVVTNSDGSTSLNILIFTLESGLGQLVIENDNDISAIEPSTSMKNTFGSNVTNGWNSISSDTTIPSAVDKIEFTTTAASSTSKVLSSYDYALTLSDVTSKLNEYTGNNFLTNLKNDMNFFFKNYLTELQADWNESGLLLNSVFVADNLTVSNKTVSGSIGMEIKNISNGTKKINLPVIGETVSVNSKATISIIIKFNNSSVKAYLTPSTTAANQAYLTTSFNNVTVTANEITTTTNDAGESTESVSSLATKTYSGYINVFPYSYSMKTIITNVGYGNTIANSSALLSQSLNALTANDLKEAKINSIETIYQQTVTGVNIAQSMLTKISNNPTVFNFLQDISSEMNKLVLLLTNDSNLASIISDMFSTKSASNYLYANLSKIISFLEDMAKTAPQLSYIIDMLVIIQNNNQTPEQMKEWVESIKDLYPTLEKLLGANLKWIMPLLSTVMTSISNDNPPIITLIFNNLEDIFSFVLDNSADNLDANLVALLRSIYDYLNTILKYSSTSSSTTNADKYKTIKVLDILSYELTATNRGTTLLTLISNILKLVQPDSTIPNLLTTINSMIGTQITIPTTIYDYSSATWENDVSKDGKTITNYKIQTANPSTYGVKLSTFFGKIIKSFLNVKVGSDTTTTTLADMMSTNTSITTTNNTFSYNASNHTVTQDLSIRMKFNQTVTIDTLPICVLLDNIKLNIPINTLGTIYTSKAADSTSGNYTTISPNVLNVSITNLDSIISGFLPDFLKGSITINSISADLGSIFPTDIVIKPNNFVDINYKATNSTLSPLVDSKTGAINWSYQAEENVTINYNDATDGILAASNTKYRISANNSNLSKQMYYGAKFESKSNGSLVDSLLSSQGINLSGHFGVDVSAKVNIPLIGALVPNNLSMGLFPLLANFNGSYSKSIMVGTSLSNPKKIENYNSKVFIPQATITQTKTTSEFKTYLSELIDKYGQWTKDSTTNTTKFSLKSGNTLAANLKNYFSFGNAFTNNNYVSYRYGFDAIAYKLLNDTYEYTFHIYLSTPTHYTTIADGSTAASSSLVTTISFTVTSNKAPTAA